MSGSASTRCRIRRALASVLASSTAVALLLSAATAFAAGRTEEGDFQRVEGTGNWEYTIDVSDWEPGKYNILVRAKDEAGNVALGGPYNVFVDPESDRPGVSISYPMPEQAVGQRLFVVGTASDDDAVGHVEVQIDDGSFVRAEGAEYWSALLPMTNLPDGPHVVRARAVDVNGVEGEPVETVFNLDTAKPVSTPTSHESGVLISRPTTIEGTVKDANGVASLTLIAEDGREQIPVRGGRGETARFSFRIDPRDMEEGATVWWLESVDGTGSRGVTPFLFYVDTSPPELQVLYPTEDDRVDGQLRIVGRVSDLVGVASLRYELSSGEADAIPLVPGDPYWSLSVDLPPGTEGAVNASFTVTDVAGNERTERVRYTLDTEGDLPRVFLAEPAADAVLAGASLSGHITDDDGASAVIYAVDGGEEVRRELEPRARDGFLIALPALAPGIHDVRVRAVDAYGNEGPEVRRRFTIAAALPSIRLTEVARGEQTEAYAPGFALGAHERATVVGQVSADAAGAPSAGAGGSDAMPLPAAPLPSAVIYHVGSETGRANVAEDGSFTVPLPRSAAGGPVPMRVFVENELGRRAQTVGFYVQLPQPEEGAPAPRADDLLERGLHLTAGSFASSEEESPAQTDAVTLAPGDSIKLLAVGGAPTDASISHESAFLSVRTSGDYVVLEATDHGAAGEVRVSATVGGRTVTSERFSLRTETSAPAIGVPDGLVGRRFAKLDEIVLDVADASGVASVTATVHTSATEPEEASGDVGSDGPDAGAAATSTARRTEEGFVLTPTLPELEGPALVRLTATDTAGDTAALSVPIVVDRSAPAVRVITPPEGELVNGTVSLYALLSEPGSTERLAVIAADGNADLDPRRLVSYEVTTGADESDVRIAAGDSAGNAGEYRIGITTNESADLPVLQLQVPREGGLVQQEFRISGVLLDDDAPDAVTYKVDDLESVTVSTSGTFDVNASMRGLEDGEHTVAVFGTDIGGAESETVTRTFAISRSEPETAVTSPSIESYQREQVTVTGTATDPNGIRAVYVSTDNGASFQLARGTEEWSFRLDTTLLADGTHSVLVRAVDGAGEDSLFSTTVNVDNTPPVLELVEPHDGVAVSDRFLVDGRGEDEALRQVRLVAQAMQGEGAPIELAAFDRTGPFAYEVDTSTLKPGWYNVRVEAEDRAGNATRVSRNLRVQPSGTTLVPQILVPADGSTVSHRFAVTAIADPQVGTVTLLADGAPLGVIRIGTNGVGSYIVEQGTLPAGDVELAVRAEPADGTDALVGETHTVSYTREGPWVSVDTPGFLSFVRDRPFITGSAGYEVALPDGDDGETQRRRRELVRDHRVERVEVSLDNGRSFHPARGSHEWQYRLETTELPDGRQNLVIRAHYANGERAVVRHSVVVDEAAPQVRLLEPHERDTFDDRVRIVGVTTDENPLADVSVVLREGDKSAYELPSFIQGLYLDVHAMGATYFDVGAGLSFFDNNVRLQAQVGMSPAGRFSGLVLGTKLLANVASLPASFFFGPDLEWLSGALALGANFSYFTMSEDRIEFTDEGLVLAGMVAQLEFPIVTVPNLPVLNTYAFYTEAQLWFISSDVEAGTAFRMSFGVRADVF